MKKLDIKPKVNPLVAEIPPHLKDHANFDKIRKALLDVGKTKHSHGEIVD